MVSELSTLIHNLVLDNPVPAKDLAKAIGKPYSTLLREVNPYDTGAKLGAETLLQIMLQTGDTKPLEYMAGKLGYTLVSNRSEAPHVTPGAFQAQPSGVSGISAAREGAQAVPRKPAVHRVRAEAQRGLQLRHAPRGGEQLHPLHGHMPRSSSYAFHSGA